MNYVNQPDINHQAQLNVNLQLSTPCCRQGMMSSVLVDKAYTALKLL